MWVEKRKTRYIFRETYKDPLTGKIKKVAVTKEKHNRITEKAALEELQLMIKEKTNQGNQGRFFPLLSDYMKSKKEFVSLSTYRNYETLTQRLRDLLPEELLIDRLTPKKLQDVINTIAIKISSHRADQVLGFVRQAYRYGVRMGLLANDNVPQRVVVPKERKTAAQVQKAKTKFLSRDELASVIKKIKEVNVWVGLAIEFQSLTGLRYGELAALRDEDYKADTKEVDINASLQWPKRKGDLPVRGQTKNAYSVRRVLLDDRAIEIIERFQGRNKQRRLWSPSRHDLAGETFIFTNIQGGPIDLSFTNLLLRKIKFNKPLSTHIFRHTHISLLAEAGVPLKAIMERVGHHEARTTLSVYTHVTDDMRKAAVRAVSRA